MITLAECQSGFLGIESAREAVGITVSYWSNLDSIKKWKANTEHLEEKAMNYGTNLLRFEYQKLSAIMVCNKGWFNDRRLTNTRISKTITRIKCMDGWCSNCNFWIPYSSS
jgi:hypothetical protein